LVERGCAVERAGARVVKIFSFKREGGVCKRCALVVRAQRPCDHTPTVTPFPRPQTGAICLLPCHLYRALGTGVPLSLFLFCFFCSHLETTRHRNNTGRARRARRGRSACPGACEREK